MQRVYPDLVLPKTTNAPPGNEGYRNIPTLQNYHDTSGQGESQRGSGAFKQYQSKRAMANYLTGPAGAG